MRDFTCLRPWWCLSARLHRSNSILIWARRIRNKWVSGADLVFYFRYLWIRTTHGCSIVHFCSLTFVGMLRIICRCWTLTTPTSSWIRNWRCRLNQDLSPCLGSAERGVVAVPAQWHSQVRSSSDLVQPVHLHSSFSHLGDRNWRVLIRHPSFGTLSSVFIYIISKF